MFYEFSGNLNLEGSAELLGVTHFYDFTSNWNTLYEDEVGFNSFWNIGDGERYWYRIEGICTKINCQTFGTEIVEEECKAEHLFLTVVTARSLKELCKNLNNPTITAPVKVQIKSIKKYSRPLAKDQSDVDDCNFLTEEQFCHIPECFQYCIDQQIDFSFGFNSSVKIIFISDINPTIINVSGSSNVYRSWFLEYVSEGGFFIEGSFDSNLSKGVFDADGFVNLNGNSEYLSNYYSYSSEGLVLLDGDVITISPKYRYFPQGYIKIEKGYSKIDVDIKTSGSLTLGGSFDLDLLYNVGGDFTVGGAAQVISPYYTYNFKGDLSIFSEAYANRKSFGNFLLRIPFVTEVSDIQVEFDPRIQSTDLTINSNIVSVPCGCSDLPLFLILNHQLNNANILRQFLLRNSFSLGTNLSIKYRSKDRTWSGIKKFDGFGLNSNTYEKWLVLFEFGCFEDLGDNYWKLQMYVRRTISNNEDFETKFLLSIPNDYSCVDNGLNLRINYDVNYNEFYANNNLLVSKVNYDDIGLFKDRFWTNSSNFVIKIGPQITYSTNPVLDLKPIFAT